MDKFETNMDAVFAEFDLDATYVPQVGDPVLA